MDWYGSLRSHELASEGVMFSVAWVTSFPTECVVFVHYSGHTSIRIS